MICMVLYIFLAIAIFDHGLNVPLLLTHFWHGKYQRIGFDYIVFIYPFLMDMMLFLHVMTSHLVVFLECFMIEY